MGFLSKDTFVCVDIEATGLDILNDRIIEIALIKFTFDEILETKETLIDPTVPIPPDSTEIHHITDAMVKGKPTIDQVLPDFLQIIGSHPLVGHGIPFDINMMQAEAKRHSIPHKLSQIPFIDTLRLARLYGDSQANSLESLRQHFNIAPHGAHRAMNDVIVNIEVFKFLSEKFKKTEEIFKRLQKPILLKTMPLGKHKGRKFNEIPLEYLKWASHQNFDQDLLYSIRTQINQRKKGGSFSQAANPFSSL